MLTFRSLHKALRPKRVLICEVARFQLCVSVQSQAASFSSSPRTLDGRRLPATSQLFPKLAGGALLAALPVAYWMGYQSNESGAQCSASVTPAKNEIKESIATIPSLPITPIPFSLDPAPLISTMNPLLPPSTTTPTVLPANPIITLPPAALAPVTEVYSQNSEHEEKKTETKDVKPDTEKKKSNNGSSSLHAPKSRTEMFYLHLLGERKVFVNGRVDDSMAFELVGQLMYLEGQSQEPITMYINSGGGKVTSGLAIYDAMQSIQAPVHTVCVGHCESMAAVLLSGGAPGCRRALPHSRIMVHQPSCSLSGRATDIQLKAKKMERTAATLNQIIAKHTGKPSHEVEAALRDDNNMSPEEAINFGLIDNVFSSEGISSLEKSL